MVSAKADILVARTVPGLHNFVAGIIERRFPKQARVLDLGCGTGAFLRLLAERGYESLMGVDRDASQYGAEFPLISADLNQAFGDQILRMTNGAGFEIITAIEVIEHLENPSNFLRECSKLLSRPHGKLLLTSPNVESIEGRLKFFRSGKLRHFDCYGDPTHITPIFSCLLTKIATNAGYQIEEHCAGPNAGSLAGSRPITRLLARCLGPIIGENRRGDCNVFLLRLM